MVLGDFLLYARKITSVFVCALGKHMASVSFHLFCFVLFYLCILGMDQFLLLLFRFEQLRKTGLS